MKLLWIWPWWLVVIVLVAGLTLCWLGWRESGARAGSNRGFRLGAREGSRHRPQRGVAHGTGWNVSGRDWRWIRRGLMVAVVSLMGAAPGVRTDVAEIGTNAEVYFVVDATGSMGAEDYVEGGTGAADSGESDGAGDGGEATDPAAGHRRIDGVRADLVALAREYPGARFSIIRFDSRATTQLPLTSDLRAVESWAETFKLESSYTSQGSTINRPADELTTTLQRSAEERPGNVRILYVFSDGESTDPYAEPRPQFAEAGKYVSGGAVLGYGTEEGGQMPMQGGYDGDGYIIDPATGQPAVSRINETVLQQVAEQLGVPYAHREGVGGGSGDGSGVSDGSNPGIDEGLLVGGIEDLLEQGSNTRSVYNVQIWPFGLMLSGLLLWEICAIVPRLREAVELRRASAGRTAVGQAATGPTVRGGGTW